MTKTSNPLLSAILQGAILRINCNFDDLLIDFSGRAWPLGHALIERNIELFKFSNNQVDRKGLGADVPSQSLRKFCGVSIRIEFKKVFLTTARNRLTGHNLSIK